MARTQLLRKARRGPEVGRTSAFATPVKVAAPIAATVAAIGLAAVVSIAAGLTALEVLIATGGVFLLATALAHRTVSSTLAGLTLLVVRPYAAGERVRIVSPVTGCPIDAVVVHIGPGNTTLASDDEVLVVPNNWLLRTPPAPAEPPSGPCPQLTS